MLSCSYCGDFHDTDDSEGNWDVKKLNAQKVYEFVCGCCSEQYITEDGILDPDLPQKMAYLDKGDAMAAMAEDLSNH
jgi:hypothetical protein